MEAIWSGDFHLLHTFLVLFGSIYLIFQALLAFAWLRISRDNTSVGEPRPVSVIIAARNEYVNLKKFLPSILTQNYPHYEILVVLDRSRDQSQDLLEQWQKEYSHLRVIVQDSLPKDWQGKKWALTQGVKAARNEYLVFTDADCKVGKEWLMEISKQFSPDNEVVLGIGAYLKYPGLLNAFIRYETSYTAFQYIGAAWWKLPYMAVGRNLAYTKKFWEKAEGWERVKERLSGDDDLLINAFARTVKVMTSRESYTWSEPKHKFIEWIKQKWRHISASEQYSSKSLLFLGIFHISHLCFYTFFLLSLQAIPEDTLTWNIFIIRTGISWLVMLSIYKKLPHFRLMYWYPIWDVLFFVYNLVIVPSGLIATPTWKK